MENIRCQFENMQGCVIFPPDPIKTQGQASLRPGAVRALFLDRCGVTPDVGKRGQTSAVVLSPVECVLDDILALQVQRRLILPPRGPGDPPALPPPPLPGSGCLSLAQAAGRSIPRGHKRDSGPSLGPASGSLCTHPQAAACGSDVLASGRPYRGVRVL